MYVSRYDKYRIVKGLIILFILFIIAVSLYFVYGATIKKNRIIRYMDERELNYSTGNPIILINKTDGYIGYYQYDMPIRHDRFNADKIPNGVYTINIVSDYIVDLVSMEAEYQILCGWEMNRNQEFQNIFPSGTIVIVYSK